LSADLIDARPELAAPSPPPVARWRWWLHLILIGGFFVPATLLHRDRTRPVLTNSPSGLLIVAGIDFLLFAAVFGVAISFSRATPDNLYLRWRPGWWVIPLGLGYSIAMRIAAAIVMLPIVAFVLLTVALANGGVKDFMQTHQPHWDHLLSVTALASNPVYYWLTITLVSFLSAGVREELWRVGTLAGLRALFPTAFGSTKGQISAVALLALLFGAAHTHLGFMGAITAGILGFFLGVIIVGHRSVWPAIFAHWLLDAATFAALPFLLKQLPHT
jgi:membrane protease YdiL (CAAX protease family)